MRRFLILAAMAVALGAFVLGYRGPGRPFVRGHVGDVAATALVYAILALALGPLLRRFEERSGARWARPTVLAVAAMVIATAIELAQRVWTGTGVAGELVLGSSFDPWDFVAYVTGTILAVTYDVSTRGGAQKIE
jgi:Protein of unknown function (DUF2809)